MTQYEDKLEYVLVEGNYVGKDEFDKAKKEALNLNIDLSQYLVEYDFITADLLGQAVAEAYGVAYADLNTNIPTKEQVLKIPEEIAKKFKVVLYDEGKNDITVSTDLPNQQNLKEEIQKIFPHKKIHIAFSLEEDVNSVMLFYEKPLESRIKIIIAENKKNSTSLILDEIFKEAITFNSSDIHLEPKKQVIRIRFRIDGVLEDRAVVPKENYESLLNRIKVLSNLRIDEHNSVQDGSIRYEKKDRSVDLRISIAPTLYGEKVVIRVLNLYVKGISLSDLGLDNQGVEVLSEASKKPFGMIINVGPTGSGKTTTLYSLIRILNKTDVNITTIEDPVEYRIENANQIQINPAKNLTFAKGLRSIVRQDPDIILVGEIRDTETAEISVNAALTGHLLLSTFHANDAATAIPRLLDMGVEPFLLASTLELIIAQRLVRKVCEHCRYSVSDSKQKINGKQITLYKGKGCNVCHGTGFNGRTAIFEYIKITPELRDLILKNPSSKEIWELALKQGSKPLFEDGIEKVKQGKTTMEELLRVAKPPEYEIKKTRTKKQK